MSIADREASRTRKFLQLSRGVDGYFEPALHVWKSRNDFYNAVLIPLRTGVTDALYLRALETDFIQQWTPRLNHPWVNSLLRIAGVRIPSFVVPSTHKLLHRRLFQRALFLRERVRDPGSLSVLLEDKTAIYHLLYKLGCTSRSKWRVDGVSYLYFFLILSLANGISY